MNEGERQALHDAVISACGDVGALGWNQAAWDAIRRIGATSLSVSEQAGGQGAGLYAATVVLLALGSAGASVPEVESGLMAGWLMEKAGGRVPAGIVTAAVGEDLEVRSHGGRWLVSGTLPRVPWARHADHVVVLSQQGGGQYALIVPLAGAELVHRANVAGEARDDIVLSAAVLPAAGVYGLDSPEPLTVDFLRRGAFGRAALMAGAAQGVYAHAARYASERRQFGRPLSAMQAIQQQLAELAAEASAMTVAVEAAAAAVDLAPAEFWVLDAARIRVGGATGTVAAIGHQILGAIGFTDEHPLHRLTTRLWAWREEYGNHNAWSNRLGSDLTGKDGTSLWQRITRLADDGNPR